jgi:polysaccharide pyruvyl transferase WcaK-like protein
VVCWRPTPLLLAEDWRPYLQALEHLAERQDREVLWLPFHREQDSGLLERLRAEGLLGEGLRRRSRELEALLPREATAVFRSAGLVLAMRLHALILAGLAGAPLAALSYDPKVRAAAAAIGCGCVDLAERDVSPAQLLEVWAAALDQPPASSAIAALQQSTQVHRQLLNTLLS